MLRIAVCIEDRKYDSVPADDFRLIALDNDDVLARLKRPVLITHGAADAIVKPLIVERHTARLPHAQVQDMANAGHAPFWADAPSFNRRLREF
jgi:pimeloyl-ACP methyl ester carboxylesterase